MSKKTDIERFQDDVDAVAAMLQEADEAEAVAARLRGRAGRLAEKSIFSGIFLTRDKTQIVEVDEGVPTLIRLDQPAEQFE